MANLEQVEQTDLDRWVGLLPEAPHLDADSLDAYELTRRLHELARDNVQVAVDNPRARHNLGIGLENDSSEIHFLGSVGYYCGGFNAGANVVVHGNAGWGLGEAMSSGRIVVRGSTAWSAGAGMRGGTIVIHGDGGPRTGIAMKGGNVIVTGAVGFMSGFMAHQGKLVVLGGAGDGLGASMYEGRIFVVGRVESFGADAIERELDASDSEELKRDLDLARIPWPEGAFKKVEAEGRLWYFDKHDGRIWRNI
ncbi:MAG: GltB/FmdC/FwdC-like GXGXG domain-containing protein [Acidimicrobiales bacterium]